MPKKKLPFTKQEILIIDYALCPEAVQNKIKKQHNFHRDVLVPFYSEFSPCGKEDYASTLTNQKLEEYWADQTRTNNFKGTLEEFIEEYGLQADKWLIDCDYDFEGVKHIYFSRG
jgi:hypothetical protein